MKSETNDIYEMLDTLALPAAAQRFAQLSKSPELGSYTALQLLREVLAPQYIETLNKRFETNLRLSSLINKGAVAENLKTGNAASIMMPRLNRSWNSTSLRTGRTSGSMGSPAQASPISCLPVV